MAQYTLSLSTQDLEAVAAGLNELPRKYSQPVFAKLQAQVTEQDAAAEKAAAEKEASIQDAPSPPGR
jgi:hypothetical protein